MKKRIRIIVLVLALAIVGLMPKSDLVVKAAGAEQENNNSYATANTIAVNGFVQGNISDRDDEDFYVVEPTSDGKLEISFNHIYQDSYDDWNVYVYMHNLGEYKELSCTNIDLNGAEKVQLPSVGVKQSGEYYIVVKRCCSGVDGVDYTVDTSFTTTDDYEKEMNNVYSTATSLSVNGKIQGNISNNDDKDYYAINARSDGKISLSFSHTFQDSYDDWNIYTYIYADGKYTELSNTNIDLNSSEIIFLPAIGAQKSGVYYIVVEKCCSGVVGVDYTINTSFTETSYYEKESNDVYGSGNTVSIGKSYSGNISNSDDKDYYKVIAPSSGYYKITFNHTYQESYDDWNVYVYKASNGNYMELSNTNVDLNSSKQINLPSVGMTEGSTYFIKVEKCCSGVVGVDYSIKVSISANGPSTINTDSMKNAVKISWNAANSVSGYELYFKVGKKGTYKKYNATSKTYIKFKNAQKGKTYYFKVRGYVKVDGKTYYSSFSKAKSAKCR